MALEVFNLPLASDSNSQAPPPPINFSGEWEEPISCIN